MLPRSRLQTICTRHGWVAARAQNPAFLELRVSNSFYSPCLFNVFLFCRTRQNVTVTLNVHKTLLFLSFGYPTRSILPVCSTCVSFAEQGRTAKTGIPAVPSDEVIKQITKEVHLHMFCDEWATCCVCDERAPTKALPGQSRTHYSCLPNTLPGSAYTMLRAPTPSGVPGTSVPGPEGSYSFTDDYEW